MLGSFAVFAGIFIALLSYLLERGRNRRQASREIDLREREDTQREEELTFRKYIEAQKILREIKLNERIQNALIMLDYHSYTFGEQMITEDNLLSRHLSPSHFSHDETDIFVRDCFDELLVKIAEMQNAIDAGVFDYSQFEPYFGYYAEQVLSDRPSKRHEAFQAYVKFSGLDGALKFFNGIARARLG